jgi:hypothetical protein
LFGTNQILVISGSRQSIKHGSACINKNGSFSVLEFKSYIRFNVEFYNGCVNFLVYQGARQEEE